MTTVYPLIVAGLFAELREPVWFSSPALVSDSLANDTLSYSHTMQAVGGFHSARLTVAVTDEMPDLWLERLGYDFTVYANGGADIVFNGFIDKISVNYGFYTLEIGPMLDIANRVRVTYQTLGYDTNPPIPGQQASTAAADDLTSQELYSILVMEVSGGSGTSTEMAQLRDTTIAETAYPKTGQTVIPGQTAKGITVELSITGYYHLLSRYYPNSSATGTINLSTKIGLILDGDPNAPNIIIDERDIESNTTQVSANYGKGNESGSHAWELLLNLLALGDSTYNRYVMGVYGKRRFEYREIDTDPDSGINYYMQLTRDRSLITLPNLAELDYWLIRPAKFMFIEGILTDLGEMTSLVKDKRAIFIESVQFDAPNRINLTGGRADSFAQKIARLAFSSSY